jgi:hypothetical protein
VAALASALLATLATAASWPTFTASVLPTPAARLVRRRSVPTPPIETVLTWSATEFAPSATLLSAVAELFRPAAVVLRPTAWLATPIAVLPSPLDVLPAPVAVL